MIRHWTAASHEEEVGQSEMGVVSTDSEAVPGSWPSVEAVRSRSGARAVILTGAFNHQTTQERLHNKINYHKIHPIKATALDSFFRNYVCFVVSRVHVSALFSCVLTHF